MPEKAKFNYPIKLECFRDVVREDEILHVTVKDTPQYSSAVSRYLQTVSQARYAVRDSKLVFRG